MYDNKINKHKISLKNWYIYIYIYIYNYVYTYKSLSMQIYMYIKLYIHIITIIYNTLYLDTKIQSTKLCSVVLTTLKHLKK